MQVRRVTKEGSTAWFTSGELLIFSNALNEVCDGVEVPDFESRVGASRDEALTLLDSIGRLLDRIDQGKGAGGR